MKKNAWLFALSVMLGVALAAAPPPFKLLSPQDGATWKIGSRQTISWNVVAGINPIVYINLWGYNSAGQKIHYGTIGEKLYQSGKFLWQVGNCPSRKVNPGNYFIVIRIWYTNTEHLDAGNIKPIHITPNWLKR